MSARTVLCLSSVVQGMYRKAVSVLEWAEEDGIDNHEVVCAMWMCVSAET